MFWSRIGHLVIFSFESAFKNGKLSSFQCKAMITLIHKGNELARNDWKNWRPISLTNSDYKLLAKCLAPRPSSVIGEIMRIKLDIKGRRVSTLIRLSNDVTEQLTVQQKPGLLLKVHYSQAFDMISKDCELCVFEKNGFGPDFLQWVCVPIQKVVWITVDGSLTFCVCV